MQAELKGWVKADWEILMTARKGFISALVLVAIGAGTCGYLVSARLDQAELNAVRAERDFFKSETESTEGISKGDGSREHPVAKREDCPPGTRFVMIDSEISNFPGTAFSAPSDTGICFIRSPVAKGGGKGIELTTPKPNP